jgi:exodeoxyribonuclease VII large subunit
VQVIEKWIEPLGAPVQSTALVPAGSAAAARAPVPEVLVVRRRSVPRLPRVVALVTSESSVACQDVAAVVARRAPWIIVRVCPVPLEGADAPDAIATAIERCNGASDIDLILLARGGAVGGAYAPFDDRRVARAIADSALPVVVGIGHAEDSTLACRVADAAHETPSAAAHALTEGWVALVARADAAHGADSSRPLRWLASDSLRQ